MYIIAFKRKAKYRVFAAPEALFNSGADTLTKVTLVRALSWGQTRCIIKQACSFVLQCKERKLKFIILKPTVHRGTAVTHWLRCCATNRKVAGSIPDGVIAIFH